MKDERTFGRPFDLIGIAPGSGLRTSGGRTVPEAAHVHQAPALYTAKIMRSMPR